MEADREMSEDFEAVVQLIKDDAFKVDELVKGQSI